MDAMSERGWWRQNKSILWTKYISVTAFTLNMTVIM